MFITGISVKDELGQSETFTNKYTQKVKDDIERNK
jgi:hypothetical protein